MEKELLDIIVCPVCKGVLDLKVIEAQDDEVITGSMQCH